MLEITRATYGDKDCTNEIKKIVKKGSLLVRADNNIIGDPKHGHVKRLVIDYSLDGLIYHKETVEGDYLSIQQLPKDRLGIFYSNNTNEKIFPAIKKSLDTIEKAADGVADIVTCVWNPIEGNPFLEVISHMKSGGHLNQLIQIMQCLYTAKNIGEYKWVSFLEHDVMYPEDYFMFEDNDSENTIFTNMNYIGVCDRGFQDRKQHDQPFHQMTMRFNDAIKHCESILENAILTNSGLIEPQNMVVEMWYNTNPSVHINHGVHFTSHYSIYDSDNVNETNDYWGDHKDYKHLFI